MRRGLVAVFLSLILLSAFFLRLWKLDRPELFGDELDVGYQAYSILKTGKDIRGFRFPLYIHSLSEARAPLYLYSTVPFVAIFGLNEWGVRLTAAFWGILDIILLFWLVRLLFKEEKIALFSALILSVVPWHIHYSRTGFEVTLLLALILAGSIFFIKSLKNKKFLCFSSISFGLSFYTYSTANVFVPFLILFFLIFYFREIKKNLSNFLVSFIIFLIVVFPLGLKILHGQASLRFRQISIFSDQKLIDSIILKRAVEGNSLIGRLFYNKLVFLSFSFSRNYLVSFSPQFLFFDGDSNSRQSVPGFGMFYWILSIPLVFGLIYFVRNYKNREVQLFIVWMLIAPLASALTSEGAGHATRLFLLLPALTVSIALGINEILKDKKGKIITIFLSIIIVFNIISYFHEILVNYPKEQFRYWHYGYKDVVAALNANQNECKKIFINNVHEPFLIRYLFWAKIDPDWLHQNFQGDQENLIVNGCFKGFSLGDVFFGRIISEDKLETIKKLVSEENSCYIAFQEDEVPGDWNLEKSPLQGLKVIKLVTTPLGNPYLYLLTKN